MTRHNRKPQIRLPRRDFLKYGGAGVLGTIIAASTTNLAGAQTPSAETVMANLKSLKMGDFNPNYATQWSYRLAQALGYMQDVGIEDFEVILSDEYIPGLVGGSLDITHGDTSVFFGAGNASGLPIKMISLYRDKEWWIMGTRKGVNTPADLKGGKISGGKLDGRNTWVMRKVVAKMGLDPDKDVEFVPTSGASDNRLLGVINGTLDGASMFPRHRAGLEEAGGKFLFAELTIAPQEGFAAMGEWLEKNEDTAYAWVRADLKARQWLFNPANKERAYKIMVDLGFNIPPAFVNLYKVELDQISPDGGFESAAAMDRFIADLAETGEVPAGLDWRKFVDMKYVWAAQDSLGIPRRPKTL
ncbi:MAG: ABC transporter substrate-binding protein [Alphaproteobacteria bacterium]|nr:ABC transporter substrate-binding protein [Alphaproteobacteria bacterium]